MPSFSMPSLSLPGGGDDTSALSPEEKAAVMENAQKVEAAATSTVDTLFAVGALFKEAQEERAIEERRRAGQHVHSW